MPIKRIRRDWKFFPEYPITNYCAIADKLGGCLDYPANRVSEYLVGVIIHKRNFGLALMLLIAASIACSADSLIGQPPGAPTPTILPFATATLGGRVSVWLITPTGQASGITPTVTPFGNIVAPAATATAAYATLQAATATAAVKFSAPVYQPNSCPDPGNPLPPLRPASFGEYPQAIGLYLSQGGATTTLKSTLSAGACSPRVMAYCRPIPT